MRRPNRAIANVSGTTATTGAASREPLYMSEKRKPSLKLVAEKQGKRLKVELFPVTLWPHRQFEPVCPKDPHRRFRVRTNGKWMNGDNGYTMTEIMRDLRKWCLRG